MVELRDYQIAAKNNVNAAIAGGARRVILVSPTGSGKTTIAADMIHGAVARGNGVLFLAHRTELIDQASARLDTFGVDHGIIQAGTKRRKDHAAVQVASVQTVASRYLRERPQQSLFGGPQLPPARVIIVDEAHRTMGDTYLKVLALYPQAVVIGLTATPVRLDGKGLADVYEHLVEAARVEDLVARGLLVDPRVFAPPAPDLSRVKTTGGDYNIKALDEELNKPRLVGSIVEHWLKHAEGQRTVAFAVSVEHSLSIRDQFRQAGVAAEHVDGNTDPLERKRILRELREGRVKVVCNVNVLCEGWDLPECAVAILARPTKSVSMYLQQVGRILRTADGKAGALVLDHAGCTRMHGRATDPREWSLMTTRPKGEAPIKTCEQCYAVVAAATVQCPNCGFIWEAAEDTPEREGIERDEATELIELRRDLPVLDVRDAWLEQYRGIGEPDQAAKQRAYDAIAARWFASIGGWKPYKVGWIFANYLKVWGIKPHHTIEKACPHYEAIKKAKDEAREAREMARIAREYGLAEETA